MAENDAARGMVPPEVKREQEREFKRQQLAEAQQQNNFAAPQQPMSADGALDDRAIAGNMLAQAQRMEREAQGLIAEAARMKKEAERMVPNVAPAQLAPEAPPPRRGRPPKARVTADAAVQ